MDRNEKSPLEWDWENHGLFSAEKEAEISEFGNRSSKSSISALIDSSSKEGLKITKSGLSKKKELTSVEPLIGLKLGKRTYFEDVTSIGNNSTKNSTCSTSPVPPTALVKKTRVSHQSIPNSRCQVEGCGIDLSGAKDYHRKNRVCESHSKCPKVIITGLERRFCQQCSRFHDLREFDLKKRSCRRRLSDHNARRRKPQSDLSFNSTGLSSPFYGDRHKMDFLINRFPFGHMRPTASSTWEDSCGFSITHSKGPWIKTTKAGGLDAQLQFSNSELSNAVPALCRDLDKILSFKGAPAEVFTQGDRHKMNFLINRSPFGHMRPTASSTLEDSCGFSITHSKGSWIKTTKAVGLDAQLQFSNSELSNAVPALCHDLDKILSFKGAPAEVFTQGVEASAVPASDLDVGGPDLGHALSLLSTDSWVHSADPGQSNLSHFVNTTSHNNSAMQAVNSTMMRYWEEEQTLVPQQTRLFPFDLHSANGGRYLEFPLSKSPLETLFLDSGQMLPILDGHFLEFKT